MNEIVLHVEESEAIKLHVEEGRQKPTQTKTAVPAYEKQIIVPDEGYLLSAVEVGEIPELMDKLTITENGDYNVQKIGTVHSDVPQGVFPSGTKLITENGLFNITEFENINVAVNWESENLRFFKTEITIEEDYSAQGTQFIPAMVALANKGQSVLFAAMVLKSSNKPPIANEIKELAIGYTTGLRYFRSYWNGSAWVKADAVNTYFNAAVQAGAVYELIGFEKK